MENSDDTRNSPTFTLVKALEVLGAHPVLHDPYVREVEELAGLKPLDDLFETLRDSDCMVLVTAHDEYSDIDLDKAKSLMRTPVIVDGRNVFNKEECIRRGFVFRGIGR